MKASYVNIRNMKTEQGASTITQQYAKNLFLDLIRPGRESGKRHYIQ